MNFLVIFDKKEMRFFLFFIILGWFPIKNYSQELVYLDNYTQLINLLNEHNEKPLVVNFWATWCGPCVKELPFFQKLHEENQNVKVITISLDFAKQVESKLIPFLNKKQYTFLSAYMADKNYNNWISKVNDDWSGAIPATWIIYNNQSLFKEEEFISYEDLNQFVNQSLLKLN